MANKTFTQLKTNIGVEVHDASTAFATIVGRFINRRYFQILRSTNWENICPDATLTTVSGTQNYVLPDDFYKPIDVYDTTNSLPVSVLTLGDLYRSYGSTIATSGSIDSCAIYEDAVQAQPTTASKLAITGVAADTSQTIQIRGIASNVEVYETQTLTGTTPVESTYTYTRITGISFDAVRTGIVTVTSNSAAVTIATIPLGMLDTRFKLMKFHYVPVTVSTINIPYIIKPSPLAQDYDYPLLDVADLIELGAISDCYKYKGQFQKSQTFELMFTQGLAEFIFDQENKEEPTQFTPTTFSAQDLY